jgi:hypothetical protein
MGRCDCVIPGRAVSASPLPLAGEVDALARARRVGESCLHQDSSSGRAPPPSPPPQAGEGAHHRSGSASCRPLARNDRLLRRLRRDVRAKLCSRMRRINPPYGSNLPDGQITDLAVQPLLQKDSCFHLTQIKSRTVLSHPTEGRIAIVTDAGWDAVDAGCVRRAGHTVRGRMALICGRLSRVVLTPRRWRQVSRSNSRDDGGKKARSPGRARNKPLKPLRRECRDISVNLW